MCATIETVSLTVRSSGGRLGSMLASQKAGGIGSDPCAGGDRGCGGVINASGRSILLI